MTDLLVTISKYENSFDAEIAKGRLQSEGIKAFIHDSHMVNVNWMMSNAIGGVKLIVCRPDAEKAAEILGIEYQDSEIKTWGFCPDCGSSKLAPKTDRRVTNLTWILLGVPLLFPRKQFLCEECGAMFKDPKHEN